MANTQINQAKTPAQIAAVKALFVEYLETLKTDFGNELGCAVGQEDIRDFPQTYLALFLAKFDGAPVAACGLKRINAGDCELGKLYCRPAGRGQALGRQLTEATLNHARSLGYKRIVLSTEPSMKHAGRLYTAMGFKDVAKYMPGQSGCSRFMALSLKSTPTAVFPTSPTAHPAP